MCQENKTKNVQIRNLLCRVLTEINSATSEMIIDDETEYGTLHIPNFRYIPTFQFTDEDIDLIKYLSNKELESFDTLTEI